MNKEPNVVWIEHRRDREEFSVLVKELLKGVKHHLTYVCGRLDTEIFDCETVDTLLTKSREGVEFTFLTGDLLEGPEDNYHPLIAMLDDYSYQDRKNISICARRDRPPYFHYLELDNTLSLIEVLHHESDNEHRVCVHHTSDNTEEFYKDNGFHKLCEPIPKNLLMPKYLAINEKTLEEHASLRRNEQFYTLRQRSNDFRIYKTIPQDLSSNFECLEDSKVREAQAKPNEFIRHQLCEAEKYIMCCREELQASMDAPGINNKLQEISVGHPWNIRFDDADIITEDPYIEEDYK